MYNCFAEMYRNTPCCSCGYHGNFTGSKQITVLCSWLLENRDWYV